MKNFKKLIKEALTPHYLREPINEGELYDSYALKMYGKKWDDLSRYDQSEVVDAVEGNYTLDQIRPVNESKT